MTQISLPFTPVPGGAEDITQIMADFAAILAVVNGDIRNDNINAAAAIARSKLNFGSGLVNADIDAAAAIAASKLAGAIPDSKLSSPNNSAYRTIESCHGVISAGAPVATYYFDMHDGTVLVATGANKALAVPGGLLYFDDADYTVAGLTQKLRMRAELLVNPTAPTSTITAGLYPVTSVSGTGGTLQVNLGTVVAGSTVAFVAPGASSMNVLTSGDFTIPADGFYVLGVAISVATVAANNNMALAMHLQTRNV